MGAPPVFNGGMGGIGAYGGMGGIGGIGAMGGMGGIGGLGGDGGGSVIGGDVIGAIMRAYFVPHMHSNNGGIEDPTSASTVRVSNDDEAQDEDGEEKQDEE